MEIIKYARKLNKKIKKSKKIFIMSHKDIDLDALGSSIGLYTIIKSKKKSCYLVINDNTHEKGVEKVLIELEGYIEVIKSSEIDEKMSPRGNKNLLIILDTNKIELLQDKDILPKFKNKLIIDHHETGKSTIEDADYIIDPKASSTCEMIAEYIEKQDVEIEPYYATILLAGIVLDTCNFTLKTSPETYYTAYYLASLGASAKKVQYLLKQDIEDYNERQKLLSNIQKVNDKIALTKAAPYTIYRKEELSKVADTLLFFNNIEVSFVIGKIGKDTVEVSARSLGNYDVSKIMERLGGGGNTYEGAAQFEKLTISKVEQKLIEEIKKMEAE